jgi:hypothetical protein
MEFNIEQAKTTIQWFFTTFGAGIIGFAAGKGWVDADMMNALINSPTVITAIATVAVGVWQFVSRSKKNRVADVAAMPEVKGVVMEPVPAATPIVAKTPENVVPAGTQAATELAKAS